MVPLLLVVIHHSLLHITHWLEYTLYYIITIELICLDITYIKYIITIKMPSAKFLRESICNVIASSASVGKQEEKTLEVELDNIINNFFHRSNNNNSSTATNKDKDNDDNVTPLMLACDKCCLDALVYIRDRFERATSSNNDDNIQLKQLIEVFGHPTEESSCGNTAAHHALASAFSEGIDILEVIWGYIEETESFQSSPLDRYLSLLSLTNQNGDTPLMMACVSGNVNTIRQIMEYSNKLAIDSNSEKIVKTWQQRIFNNVNNDNCTALNLAFGHAKLDVVMFLIEPQSSTTDSSKDIQPLVNVTYSDIECCQKTIQNVTAGLNFMKQNQVDRVKEFEDQLQQVNACLSLLQCQLERLSIETANELAMDEQTAARNTNNNDHKPKGKGGKKKRNRKKKNQTHKTETGESKVKTTEAATDKDTTQTTWATRKKESMIEQTSISAAASPFTTLQDGTIISKTTQKADYVSAKDELSVLDDDVKSSSEAAANPKSLENILSTSQASNGDDITSIMESLCLDPTMLLLSPHGMAIDCSPCQLEAMQSILSHQLKAVKEAQQIQSRLLEDK